MISMGATFSPCRTWRYILHRQWDTRDDFIAFIGLNPSTADETKDDPTVRRCIGYAKQWGHAGLYMLNIFAYRATDPANMKAAVDPVGPENDTFLLRFSKRARSVVAAWGTHGTYRNRGLDVIRLLGNDLMCLGTTKDGHPKHPLYLRADILPTPLWTNA